jgi:RNA polymerase sigma-70 factor (ECF subfamily)
MSEDRIEMEEPEVARPDAEVLAALVAAHRDFLAFVQRRVGDRALAEDIVQAAFIRAAPRVDTVRESPVGWFYRLLRNAIIDHQRGRAAEARRLESYRHEARPTDPHDDELHAVVCRCVGELAGTLRPEYARALRRIELDGVSVKDFAAEAGISASNAGVRIFRARKALRAQVVRACGTCAEHGCLDCTCQPA